MPERSKTNNSEHDAKIERYRKCQNAGDHSFPDEYIPFKMLVLSVKVSVMITVTFTKQSM